MVRFIKALPLASVMIEAPKVDNFEACDCGPCHRCHRCHHCYRRYHCRR